MSEPGTQSVRKAWDASFEEQISQQAYNTAAVEAVIRNVAYYLRRRVGEGKVSGLRFLEMGCGAGPNLIWLAQKGVRVSGVDISPKALELARRNLERHGCSERVDKLVESSVTSIPFEEASFDGVIEACVFQHLRLEERRRAFAEVGRVLKPGGVFVGYMLDVGHSVYRAKKAEQLPGDPGTLLLKDGSSRLHLTNLGVCHFYTAEELKALLPGFSVVDPCITTYALPNEEALRRGYPEYLQSMWTVYAIK